MTDDQPNKLERLSDHLIDYLDARWDLLVLKGTQKASNLIASIASSLLLLVLAILLLNFLSLSLAVWIGVRTDNLAQGLLIVAGLYALLLVAALLIARKLIRTAIAKNIIHSLNNNNDDEPYRRRTSETANPA